MSKGIFTDKGWFCGLDYENDVHIPLFTRRRRSAWVFEDGDEFSDTYVKLIMQHSNIGFLENLPIETHQDIRSPTPYEMYVLVHLANKKRKSLRNLRFLSKFENKNLALKKAIEFNYENIQSTLETLKNLFYKRGSKDLLKEKLFEI